MDRRRTQNLVGKCGSCRFFTVEQGLECTGFCSGRMKQKGRLERTYKCIGYEAAPTILEAEEKKAMISVEDLRKWADEHAIGRSPSYPRGWVSGKDLQMLSVQVEQNEPLNFYYSTRSNMPKENENERLHMPL